MEGNPSAAAELFGAGELTGKDKGIETTFIDNGLIRVTGSSVAERDGILVLLVIHVVGNGDVLWTRTQREGRGPRPFALSILERPCLGR